MLGQTMGDLHLDISVNGIIIRDIMPIISGNQGSSWIDQTIDLTPYRGTVKLVFRGVTGTNYTSDIAIDDVILYDAQPVGLNESINTKSSDWSIYPNPNDGSFRLSGLAQNTTLKIYNSLGEVVFKKEIREKSSLIQLNHLTTGIYFIEVISENNRSIKRMIVQ
jgi:hypothetical protein